MPTIYFDMDGTLFDLYSVPDWLSKLRSCDPSPYAEATPMINMRLLAYFLNRLKKRGYRIGVISWLSKDSNPNYDEVVRIRKRRSLKTHLKSVKLDEIHLVKYGKPKHYIAKDKKGILFDDNPEIRESWTGRAYTEKEILQVLKELLK